MSDRDRYYRFFHVVPSPEELEVATFVQPSPRRVGIIALDEGEAVGAAHAFIDDEGTAEFAVVVRPGHRHEGIGGGLLAAVAGELKARGAKEIIAHSLRENTEFGLIAREAQMRPQWEGPGIVRWTMKLTN